jgi:hypothetical protein
MRRSAVWFFFKTQFITHLYRGGASWSVSLNGTNSTLSGDMAGEHVTLCGLLNPTTELFATAIFIFCSLYPHFLFGVWLRAFR